MIQCDLCEKKLVTPKQMENHKEKVHGNAQNVEGPAEIEQKAVESQSHPTPTTPPAHQESPDLQSQPHEENAPDLLAIQPDPEPVASEKIILRFSRPVQVIINGIKYPEVDGKVIEAPNIAVATEIVRIVRESQYGDVLER